MTEAARVIRPIQITPDVLISSNVPEDDYPEWEPGTYAAETWVMHNHKVWQALKETSKEPGAADAANDWNDGGATNRYRMFDNKVGSQTVMVNGIEVEVQSDQFVDSIALLNVFGNAVRITMTDPLDGVVFEREIPLVGADVDNWWDYFFLPIQRRVDVVIDDLPRYAGALIKVEVLVAEDDVARIGWLVIGARLEIGCARWGSSVSIRDYSIKDFDEFGNVTVIERDWSKRPELDLLIDTSQVDNVLQELARLRAIPCVYIGHSRFTMTIAVGFYRELMIVLSNPSVSEGTLTIEALT